MREFGSAHMLRACGSQNGPPILYERQPEVPMRLHPLRLVASLFVPLLVSCGGGEDAGEDVPEPAATTISAPVTVSGVGFSTPESVLHDTGADVYLVSNINGAPLDEDGNGFISRLSPSGEVLSLRWIDGEADGVTLNAPKGMAIRDGTLYVADIDCIRRFDASTGAPSGEVCVEGASFLNDVAPHYEAGVVFTDTGLDASFSSTGTDAVYHLVGDEYETVVAAPDLGAPNGVAAGDGSVTVVTFMSGDIFRLDEDGRTDLLGMEGAQLDGVELLADGGLLVSDWGASCVHRVTAEGQATCVIGDVESPADIGLDRERNRVLIPLFNADEVWMRPVE